VRAAAAAEELRRPPFPPTPLVGTAPQPVAGAGARTGGPSSP
jgi:hypothetical protein